MDPLAEKYPNKMPYHYVSNDPIMRIDPTGMKDRLKTEEAAFEDFGKEYNGLSIRLDQIFIHMKGMEKLTSLTIDLMDSILEEKMVKIKIQEWVLDMEELMQKKIMFLKMV